MKLVHTLSFVAAALLGTRPAGAKNPEELLAWVEREIPRVKLGQDLAAGRTRFLGVCGISCEPVGVRSFEYALCYSRSVALDMIEGTSDYQRTAREALLNERAREFAQEYNELLRERVDAMGLRDCPAGEDWDALFFGANAVVQGVEPDLASGVGARAPLARPLDLGASFSTSSRLTDEIRHKLCAVGIQAGIRLRFSFEVDFRSGEPSVRLVCEDGAVVP